MNCPVNYDDKAERLVTHPGLLPAKEREGPSQKTPDCVRKTGVVTIKKAEVTQTR